jgi:hypothetical protein
MYVLVEGYEVLDLPLAHTGVKASTSRLLTSIFIPSSLLLLGSKRALSEHLFHSCLLCRIFDRRILSEAVKEKQLAGWLAGCLMERKINFLYDCTIDE